MALQQLSFGCLPRRSVDACLFAVPASASISVPSDTCVRIPCWDGASSSSKRFPFLGARVPSACDPKRLNWRKRVSEVVQVQLKEYGFDDHSKDYQPNADFYKVEAVLRSHFRPTNLSMALLKMGIRGVTVTDVRGFGAQGGSRERQAGTEYDGDSYLKKVKLEIVVSKDQVEAVIDTIIEQARTGEIGDGKIFVSPVADIIRIRTGERGLKAERMAGGRAAMQTSVEGSDGN